MPEWVKGVPDPVEAGMVVDTARGQYLVGDTNEVLGVCDDCLLFTSREITRWCRPFTKRGDLWVVADV